ncbi:hybrid sensor histidine kinase/response regulator [uncultured Roseibium sp.]|uniref:ATP-binding response regulator n=1 Tax=uncultured Roseibium sp. TaxID=1936171 RepID=UPI00321689D6
MKAENGNETALLAHDLRTPLAAMKTTAELIAKGTLSQEQSEYLSILLQSIDALTDMTENLIRPNSSEAQGAKASKDAPALVREVFDLFRPLADRKGLGFDLVSDAVGRPIEAGRAASLRRVVTTLVDNAIKYTAKGSVTVTVRSTPPGEEDDADLTISVADTGPGIDPAERDRLFAPFVRGKTGRASGDGSGLGLWGAVQLIRRLGGKLRLVSPKSGGCRFEITVPSEKTSERDAGSQTNEEFEILPPGERHVLIVDDNDTNRRLLSALLESFGMTCEEAESGPAAIEMLTTGTFDAALMDLHMPGMSGLEVAEKLLAVRTGEKIPLIAVTAAMESVGDKRLKDAGFLEVLTKPLSPSLLFQALEHARDYRENSRKPDAPVPL